MTKYVNHNGKIVATDEVKIETSNRSFRYGDGLFETIRIIEGKMPLFDRHIQRLNEGLSVLKITLPSKWKPAYIKEQVEKLTKDNKHSKNGRIRFMVYRSGTGLFLPEKNEGEVVIESLDLKTNGFVLNEEGIIVDIFTDMEKTLTRVSNFKTNNCLLYVMASIYRKEKKLGDCLVINSKNRVIEGISSNLFLVKNREIYTPPLAEGCVAGVMRSFLLELLTKNNYRVHETPLTLEDLFTGEELFLSDSVNGIRWARKYKTHEYSNTITREISEILNNSLS